MTTTGKLSASNSGSGPPRLRPAVLTDFDDTAAVQNVAELLLERFGDPTWRQVRQRFRDGELNLKEYQEITFRNIGAGRAAMQHYVKETAKLRPYFAELRSFCQRSGIPLAVVSQGLDFYIEALLERYGLGDVPVYAVNTRFDAGCVSYYYRYARPGQESSGNSKGRIVEGFQQQGYYVIYAGDGLSDLEAARCADLVFAHRTLAEYCRTENIAYRPFSDFRAVLLAAREQSLNQPDAPETAPDDGCQAGQRHP